MSLSVGNVASKMDHAFALLVACALNPLLTGQPQDWQEKPVVDLKTGLGEPTKVIPQSEGTEIWEYLNSGDYVAPKEENTSFRMGGAGGSGMFGASGGINTVTQGQRLSRYENISRFRIKNGKVKGWYAARVVDGRTLWDDH